MLKVKSWMKSATVITFLFASMMSLTACNEVHPDNEPGAVNNPYPELSVAATSTVSIDAADASMVYSIPVNLSVAAPENGQVNFRLISGTAIQGRDYEASSGSVAFNKGDRQANIEITLLNDATRSQARDFRIELIPSTNARLSSNVNHSVTIAAIESTGGTGPLSVLTLPATLEFIAPAVGEANYSVVLPLSTRLNTDASVQINSLAGTAREGVHYRPVSGPNCVEGICSIAKGAAELVFALPVIGQAIEDTRSFKLQFLAATGVELDSNREIEVSLKYTAEAVVPTLNVPSSLSLRMPSIERGTVTYPVIITLSDMLQHSAKLQWRTVDDSAIAGVHYQAVNATGANAVMLSAGQSEFEIELELLHDQATNEDIRFQLQLVSAEGLTLPSQRVINVEVLHSNEQDTGYPRVSMPDTFVLHEPAAGSQDYNLHFALSEALPEAAEVGIRFIAGSAEQGLDFDVVKETLRLDKGTSVIALPVRLMANATATNEVSFQVELHSPLNINLPRKKTFEVRVIDQADVAPEPQLTLSPQLIKVPVPRWNLAEDITLYFQLTDVAVGATVNVQSRNGTAVAGVDFSSAIATSVNGSQLNVDLRLLPQDLGDEPREFDLIFTQASGVQLPESRVVTIQIEPRETPALPDLVPPQVGTPVEFNAPAVGAPKTRKIVLPLSNVAPLAGTLTVFIENGSAQAGVDFSLANVKSEFGIGAQEVVVEFEIEPTAAGKGFRVILESAENLALPATYEARIIEVIIL
ncbi:Calx-beta domain-containing protein [Aliidiomarina quisquiliarum]|uniref:Calx-beta domain-containing protein n=1 Tax=Aliidiomarina quisquiliarum TaxID=2938947 RepID=UPI00208FF762|nr:Calx-beta domain-containing protein [Aliidiomarina quisquiliarum]MCO4322489.1 hypothetical protein [Aliidiomarina quisquiliarum]